MTVLRKSLKICSYLSQTVVRTS